MAEGKKGFVLYADYRGVICKLTDVKAGRLFKHIMMYVNDENPVMTDEVIDLVFEPIKQQLKRDLEKWKHKSEVRSELGKQGGLKSGEKRRQSKQNEANEAIASNLKQNEQVTDKENVTVKGNVINIYKIKIGETVFSKKPSDIVFEIMPARFETLMLTTLSGLDSKKVLDAFDKEYSASFFDDADHFFNSLKKTGKQFLNGNTKGTTDKVPARYAAGKQDYTNTSF